MIRIKVSVLKEALTSVSATISSNPVREVLGAVLITMKDGNMSLQSTNIDASTIVTINECQGDNEQFYIQHAELVAIVNSYKPDEQLELSILLNSNTDYLIITKGKSTAKIQLLSVKDAPEFILLEGGDSVTFTKEVLLTAIEKTKICMYVSNTRYNIHGLHFDIQKDAETVNVVATDGSRLAFYKVEEFISSIEKDIKITIPYAITHSIYKLLKNANSEVTMSIDENKTRVQINFGGVILTTKLIDAEFPDYIRVMPKEYSTYFTCNTVEMIKTLKEVGAIYNNTPSGTQRIDLNISNNAIKFTCSKGVNQTTAEIICQTEITDMLVVANIDYLIECLSLISTKECIVHVETIKAMIIRGISLDGKVGVKYIVMPMKV